jgi:hypothetical protein
MNQRPYTYTVIRYVHDRGVGETLNVGVVMYASGERMLAWRLEHSYGRLSDAFSEFNGDLHRTLMKRTERALRDRQVELTTPGLFEPADVSLIMKSIWRDQGLSYVCSDVYSGVTSDLQATLANLFYRLVSGQSAKLHVPSRSDEEVWQIYREKLQAKRIDQVLRPEVVQTPLIQLKCDHTFRNERLHVVQAVTFDYARPDRLQDKATRWLGTASALEGHPDLGTLYLLLGRPQNTSPSHESAYDRAKELLKRIPIECELIEEEQAEQFADDLAETMRRHGLVGTTKQ